MLQDNGNFKDLIVSVPSDVQALVLLHNGVSDSNYTSEYLPAHICVDAFCVQKIFNKNLSLLQLHRVICCNFTI